MENFRHVLTFKDLRRLAARRSRVGAALALLSKCRDKAQCARRAKRRAKRGVQCKTAANRWRRAPFAAKPKSGAQIERTRWAVSAADVLLLFPFFLEDGIGILIMPYPLEEHNLPEQSLTPHAKSFH
jgi:hypothetical protein